MRILYLTESTGWSGGAHQVLLMAKALRERGHDLILACQSGSDIAARAAAVNVPVSTVGMRQDYDIPAAFTISRLVKQFNTEILHAQHSTAHALGLLAAALSSVPVFVVSRRVTFTIRRNPFSRLKYLSSRIDGYVAISQPVRQELMKAGIAASRIDVVPSVVEPQAVSPGDREAVRQEFSVGDAPLVGIVANYAVFKGQAIMARAIPLILARHPGTVFLFAGRDMDEMTGLIKELKVENSVRLAGFRTDVPRLLKGMDLFVMPSLEEAAGTALREAMLSGLACVGSRVGGIPESIVDESTGLLAAPGDPADLARAVIRLLDQPEERQRLAHAGRAFILEHYTVSKAADLMEAFYRRLLEKKKA
jgi:glycosyltransferase involved in cell wall biosynthesis